MITLLDIDAPSSNPDHILWILLYQLLLNAIIGFVSTTPVQFISTSTTSRAVWTTFKKTYASPSRRRIMFHPQNLTSNRTITDYMQDVKHNIDFLALMNIPVDFDELSIRVLNGLGPAYLNLSHVLQVWETLVRFEELFEHLLNYEAQLQLSLPSTLPASTPAIALVTLLASSSHRQSNNPGR